MFDIKKDKIAYKLLDYIDKSEPAMEEEIFFPHDLFDELKAAGYTKDKSEITECLKNLWAYGYIKNISENDKGFYRITEKGRRFLVEEKEGCGGIKTYSEESTAINKIANIFGTISGAKNPDKIFEVLGITLPPGNKYEKLKSGLNHFWEKERERFPEVLQELIATHKLSQTGIDKLNPLFSIFNLKIIKTERISHTEGVILYPTLKVVPAERIEGLIPPGTQFTAKMKVEAIIEKAQTKLFILDPYFHKDTLYLLAKVPKDIEIKILGGSKYEGEELAIACKNFQKEWQKFEIRISETNHERYILKDWNTSLEESWKVGHTLKDIGSKMTDIWKVTLLPEDKKVIENEWVKARTPTWSKCAKQKEPSIELDILKRLMRAKNTCEGPLTTDQIVKELSSQITERPDFKLEETLKQMEEKGWIAGKPFLYINDKLAAKQWEIIEEGKKCLLSNIKSHSV